LNGYLLIISTHAPYHSSHAIDAYEAALAATNVGIEVKILFQHDGVYQCLSSQEPNEIGHKNVFKKLNALALFDIEDVYIDQESIELRELRVPHNENINWQLLGKKETLALQHAAQQILVF